MATPPSGLVLTREEAEAAGQAALERVARGEPVSIVTVHGPGYAPPTTRSHR